MTVQLQRYLPEMHYFRQYAPERQRHAIAITAISVGAHCTHYAAGLVMPIEGVTQRARAGALPKTPAARTRFLHELLDWIFSKSACEEVFTLYLDDNPVGLDRNEDEPCPKFCHHDDSCCSELMLTDTEFKALQRAWRKHGLPADLFYEESKAVCVGVEAGMVGKALRSICFFAEAKRCFTPREWEARKGA